MFYLTPVIIVMRLLSETLPSSWHRQHLEVDKMIEEHSTKVGSALPQNTGLPGVERSRFAVYVLLWEGRNERRLENWGCSMSIQLGWAGLGHLMCVNPGSALLKAATEKQGFCGNYIAWPVISRRGGISARMGNKVYVHGSCSYSLRAWSGIDAWRVAVEELAGFCNLNCHSDAVSVLLSNGKAKAQR